MYKFNFKYINLRKATHYTAAFVILVTALSRLPELIKFPVIFSGFALAGLIILIYAIFTDYINHKFYYADPLINILEALCFAAAGYFYSTVHRPMLQIVLLFASFNYFVSGIFSFKTLKNNEDK